MLNFVHIDFALQYIGYISLYYAKILPLAHFQQKLSSTLKHEASAQAKVSSHVFG